jgi:hypothetical protein
MLWIWSRVEPEYIEAGRMNIHSVSAMSINSVKISEGEDRPIAMQIEMSNPAGIFQVDNLLGAKIKGSGIEDYIHIEALISEGEDQCVVHFDL